MDYDESKLFCSNFFFHSALAILEPQVYIVVEQFGAEFISLLSGRLVFLQIILDIVYLDERIAIS